MGYMLSGDAQLFQPDTMLPSQFFAAMRRKVPQEAEYRLVVAVLEDAIQCYQKHWNARDPRARDLFREAEGWMASDDRSWPFSFVNICDLLGLNPAYVRRGLQRWVEYQSGAWPHEKLVTLEPEARAKIAERRDLARAS